MKKHIILFCMITVAVLGFAANESVEVYEARYDAELTHVKQLEILRDMVKTQPADATDFYARSLRKLVGEYTDIKRGNEKEAANEKGLILANQLGAAKYAPAASDLWLVAEKFEAPLTRAEALIALGNIPATAFLPQVIRLMESLNVKPTPNRLAGERVATGAIVSLERYQDPSGYLPVFFASIGWYSDIVRNQAAKSLALISEDPSSYMMQVVKETSYNPYAKLAALRNIETTKVDNKKKAEIAVEALNQGWKIRISSRDVEGRKNIVDLRMLAINMINRYRSDDKEIYRLLELSSTDKDSSLDEKLAAIATLASQGTEEATIRLSNILVGLNRKRIRDNIDKEDESLVRAVIPALGQLGFPQGQAALKNVYASNWPPAMGKLADEALEKIISNNKR